MTIPLPIETKRLLIRPFEEDDVDPMTELYGDPAVMRHVAVGVLDRDGTAALLEQYRRAQARDGFSTGAVVGDVGLGLYAPTGEPEPDNEHSLRIAERPGFRTVDSVVIDDRPHLLLGLERP